MQATILELLEETGLPPICVSMALEEDAALRLGDVLGQAVKDQRSRRNPKKQLWQVRYRSRIQKIQFNLM